MTALRLPLGDGTTYQWQPSGRLLPEPRGGGINSRDAYAAVHVVADPLRDPGPGGGTPIDWDATLAYRRYIWSLGLGVAEAMDTAQRGMGLNWAMAMDLITRTAGEAVAEGGRTVLGIGTDQLAPQVPVDLAGIVDAYLQQVAVVEEAGGDAILMASRSLARIARSGDDYLEVYDAVISQLSRPVMIHWLGEMFDPQLAGYWGSHDAWEALETVIALARQNSSAIAGIKISLLNGELEKALRKRLPDGVRVYTGDDFNFVDLILGDEAGHSDALLGIFDPIAPAAALALEALDENRPARYNEVLEPTIPLARHLFGAPTYDYKTGVVFLAYLNGHQDHFHMLDGAQSARSLPHLCRLLTLADDAGLLHDPDMATARMKPLLAAAGID